MLWTIVSSVFVIHLYRKLNVTTEMPPRSGFY